MADNVSITPGAGQLIAADGVVDGALGNVSVQYVKIMDGTLNSTNKAVVGGDGALLVDVNSIPGPVTVQGNASATPVPISGNVGLIGNQSVSVSGGSVGLLGGSQTIGALTGNQTVVVTSGNIAVTALSGNVAVTGNVGITGNVGLAAGTNAIGNVTAIVTALPAGTNAIGNITAVASIGGNVSVIGPVAGNATVAGNPVQSAKRAVTAEAFPNGNNTVVLPVTDAVGKAIIMPYANKENWVYGNATIGNTSATTIIPAQGAGIKIYVTGLYMSNTGNTTILATTNSAGNLPFIVPSGGGSNLPFPTPLTVAGNTAFSITASGNTTSLVVSAIGYIGT